MKLDENTEEQRVLEDTKQAPGKGCSRRVKYSNVRGDGKWAANIGELEAAHLPLGRERSKDYVLKRWRALPGADYDDHSYYDDPGLRDRNKAMDLPNLPDKIRKHKKRVRVIEVPKSLCYTQSDEELAKACMEALIGAWLRLSFVNKALMLSP